MDATAAFVAIAAGLVAAIALGLGAIGAGDDSREPIGDRKRRNPSWHH